MKQSIDWETVEETDRGLQVNLAGSDFGGSEWSDWTGRFHTALTGLLRSMLPQAQRGWGTPRIYLGGVYTGAVIVVEGATLADRLTVAMLLNACVDFANEAQRTP
jgi:hypothetical protein